MILVDTDILVDLLRGYPPALQWTSTIAGGGAGITIPGFVAMELIQGCRNRNALDAVDRLLQRHHILWPSDADLHRSVTRFGGVRLSHGHSALDALIAETAIGGRATLHTFSTKHFAAYSELQTLQPYQKARP